MALRMFTADQAAAPEVPSETGLLERAAFPGRLRCQGLPEIERPSILRGLASLWAMFPIAKARPRGAAGFRGGGRLCAMFATAEAAPADARPRGLVQWAMG